jgi:Flp pilus assembly pilin Flp
MFAVLAATKRVLRDRKGVSASEYVLMVAGIAALVATAAASLGTNLSTALGKVGTYVSNHTNNFPQ